ncbi:tetratricopeptide repeat protein [Sphingomonas aracearum]|uniref:Tetratricopeptide repeat protein n=1 Tax=Sphingomonas aracearum TaxID=2283317 RepID=A0A369VY21_9SPHN|nr:tetratricopeptide repeat protein [Sphingomonas aracearum]RDE04731.1 tetratricopeptide repeat protein [Sphingomonas aracearum]
MDQHSREMFRDVPVQVWLLLLLAAIAAVPARNVVAHLTGWGPSDANEPADTMGLGKGVAIVAAALALGIFIFTQAAADMARAPRFFPLIELGLGGAALWTVWKAYKGGNAEPLLRGVTWRFERLGQPIRYWSSVGWNLLLGSVLVLVGGQQFLDAPKQVIQDRCRNDKDRWSAAEALAACNEALADGDAPRGDLIFSRGTALYTLGRYDAAEADYAAALRSDPDSSAAHYNLGLVRERRGRREQAVADYSAAIRLDPGNTDAHFNRGRILMQAGRIDSAIADFTAALEREPGRSDLLAGRGLAFAWKRDRTRAERDLAGVATSDPSYVIALHGKAVLALYRDDLDGVVRMLSAAIARAPADGWAYAMRAGAYRHLGEADREAADRRAAERLRARHGRPGAKD